VFDQKKKVKDKNCFWIKQMFVCFLSKSSWLTEQGCGMFNEFAGAA